MADSLATALNEYRDMFHNEQTQQQATPKAKIGQQHKDNGHYLQRVSVTATPAGDEHSSPDRHIIQRVPRGVDTVAATDAVADDHTSPDRRALQRVPATTTVTYAQTSTDKHTPQKVNSPSAPSIADDISEAQAEDDTSVVAAKDDSSPRR